MKSMEWIKYSARDAMGKQLGTAILVMLILVLIGVFFGIVATIFQTLMGIVPYIAVRVAAMLIGLVLSVNVMGIYIKIYENEFIFASELLFGLEVDFTRKLGGMLWRTLWTYIWLMLFIVPGIIKSISYHFVPHILADCPDVTPRQALKLSMRITEGRKMEIFIFFVSWIGWWILTIFTCGILGIVYVGPYYYTANAGLYVQMREQALAEGRITLDDLGKEEIIPPVWDEN